MKPAQLAFGALVAVVVFACGIGVGLVLGEAAAPAHVGSGPAGSSPAAIEDGAPEAPGDSRPSGGRQAGGETGTGRRPREPGGASGTLHSLVDEFQAPEIPLGTGVIRGSVKTATGLPVENVRIVATARRPEDTLPALGPGVDASVETTAREVVERHLFEVASKLETTSDEQGEFELEGASQAQYAVSAWRHGYLVRPRRSSSVEQIASTDDVLEFVATAVVEVPVRVLLPDGSTPPTATVLLTTPGRRSSARHAWIATRPVLLLEAGSFAASAQAGQDSEFQSEQQEIEIGGDGPSVPIVFQLDERTGVSGRLVYAPGQSFDRAQVYLLAESAFTGGDEDAQLVKEGQRLRVRGSAPFRYLDLEPGAYRIGANVVSGPLLVQQRIEVGDGLTEIELPLPALPRDSYVLVTVSGPGGASVDDASVRAGYRSGTRVSSRSGAVVRQADGSFIVLHAEAGSYADKPDLERFVRVYSASLGTLQATYTMGASPSTNVAFQAPATMQVDVVGAPDADPTGVVQVRLERRVDGSVLWSHSGVHRKGLDPAGRLTIGPLSPGSYELVVLPMSGSLGRRVAGDRTPVEVASGVNERSVSAPTLFDITVSIPTDVTGGRVRLQPAEGRSSTQRTPGADGTVRFDQIPAGAYKITFSANGQPARTQDIDVPSQTSIRF